MQKVFLLHGHLKIDESLTEYLHPVGSTKEKDRDDINKQGKARLSNDKDKDKGGKFKEKPERLKKDGNNGTGDGDIATKPVTVILKVSSEDLIISY